MFETSKIIRFSALIWISAMVIVMVALAARGTAPALAAPNARDCSAGNAAILAPQSGATVSGLVQIEGTASLGGDFQYYKLEVAPTGTEAWGDLAGQAQQQVVNGQLGVWDSAAVPAGTYTLRLRVVDPTGNYCETTVGNIVVGSSLPPTIEATPLPVDTPAPTEAPPIQNAVPTQLPTAAGPAGTGTPARTITPPAGPSRTPEPGSSGIGGIEIGQVVDAATQFFAVLGRIFVFGVIAMAGIFLLVGVVYFVRRVL